ncbi:MAG: glycosyltransferase family 2 protein [Thermoanaerobaculia bacterium]
MVDGSQGKSDVCVITPSYNQGGFIERTIRSVLDQDVEGLDYLVVDGGSADGTVDVLCRFEDRLRWISEPDDGQADAVNKGLAATGAEIIGWLNSDDVYYPGALTSVRHYFAEHPEIDVVYGQADHIDEHDAVLETYYSESWDAERLKDVCFICQPATFFRRRVVERFGPLDPRLQFCMDYEYWLRLSRDGARFAYLDRPLAGSRLYESNKTLGQRVAVHREINDMLKNTFGAVPDRWLSNYSHAVLQVRGMSHEKTPLRFAFAVSALCWLNAWRWNRKISRDLWQTTSGWIRGNAAAWRAKRTGR